MSGWVRARNFAAQNNASLLAAGIAVVAVYFLSGYFTPVRFDRERIEVRVTPGQIHVRGLYHYANTSRLPAVLTLRVPFPVDSDHPQPEWFTLCDSSGDGREGKEIIPTVQGGGASFRLIFRPRESKWVRLDYVQPSRVNHGRYLLTTTKPWGRPIGRTDYVLRLPLGMNLLSSNYQVSPPLVDGAWEAFTFSKTEFFPGHDWEFAWSDPGVETAMHQGGGP